MDTTRRPEELLDPEASASPAEDASSDLRWMLRAKCRGVDPEEFFPGDSSGFAAAQRLCANCPVRAECLEYALANRIELGVWGGASQRERRRIACRRRGLAQSREVATGDA